MEWLMVGSHFANIPIAPFSQQMGICQNIAFSAHFHKVFFSLSVFPLFPSCFIFRSYGFSWRFSHFASMKKKKKKNLWHDYANTIMFSSYFKLIEIFIFIWLKKNMKAKKNAN